MRPLISVPPRRGGRRAPGERDRSGGDSWRCTAPRVRRSDRTGWLCQRGPGAGHGGSGPLPLILAGRLGVAPRRSVYRSFEFDPVGDRFGVGEATAALLVVGDEAVGDLSRDVGGAV